METFSNFDSGNSNDLDFAVFDFMPISDSQQRQTTNGNRNSVTVSSANLTSQPSHSFYSNMLPTPESNCTDAVCPETLILSPYNMLSASPGHLNIEEADDTYYPLYFSGMMSPHASPTLSPDAPVNNHSMNRRQNKKSYSPKHQKPSSNNIKKSSFTNPNDNNVNSDNSVNGHNSMIQSIIAGSPHKLPSDQIIFSLLELTSPMLDNMATSIASRETMPNLNLGSNLVSDVTNTHSPTNESSSDKIAPITPSSLMEIKRKQPNSPKSGQNESKSQDRPQQLQPPSKDHSTFIAPTSPTQLNHIRTNTGPASPSSRKSIRSSQNASSPLALGPSKSPHSLKPTISPNLKPKLAGVIADEVAEQLANKSNYRSILEGTAQSLGISYSSDVHSSLESRRTTHKAAEQKRRDSLKQSFDELKKVVPLSVLSSKNNNNSDDGNNSKSNGKSDGKSDGNKNVSKLFLLKRAHDHIVELEQKSKEKDELIQKLKGELDELRGTKRQKIEEKEENVDNEEDTRMVPEDEQQASLT